MKSYMDVDTRLRTAARKDFQKEFYKLMNNLAFGKMMENVRRHRNIKFGTTWNKVARLEVKPNSIRTKMFHDNFAAVELERLSVILNKMIYIGQVVLDISKTLMYEFHYDYDSQIRR